VSRDGVSSKFVSHECVSNEFVSHDSEWGVVKERVRESQVRKRD